MEELNETKDMTIFIFFESCVCHSSGFSPFVNGWVFDIRGRTVVIKLINVVIWCRRILSEVMMEVDEFNTIRGLLQHCVCHCLFCKDGKLGNTAIFI